MKKLVLKRILFILFIALIGCDKENIGDCFQTEGELISIPYELGSFSKIRIEKGMSLLLKQGDVQEVVLITGKNLLSDVEVRVEDNMLIARDNNGCNLVRDYVVSKLVVTAPNITQIRNASQFDVVSDGVLAYPKLELLSNTRADVENIKKDGRFILHIDSEVLKVDADGLSIFDITGSVGKLQISFFDQAPRFNGEHLIAQNVQVYHRAANKIIVNPQEKIEGTLISTGDVIAVNRPPIVEVEERWTGRLIFDD